jgi:acetyl-CoA synthetase
MNLNGIKVSSAEIEQVLNSVNGIRETAAIAVSRPSQLVIYAVLSPEPNRPNEILKETLQSTIRKHLNPLFKIHDIVIIDTLPRTASNKVMRRILRDQYQPPSTDTP